MLAALILVAPESGEDLADLLRRLRTYLAWYPPEVSVVASLHGPDDGPVRDAVLNEVLDD